MSFVSLELGRTKGEQARESFPECTRVGALRTYRYTFMPRQFHQYADADTTQEQCSLGQLHQQHCNSTPTPNFPLFYPALVYVSHP